MTKINQITIKDGITIFSEGGDLEVDLVAPNMAVLSVKDVTDPDPPKPQPGERAAHLSYRQVAHFEHPEELTFTITVEMLGEDGDALGAYRIAKLEHVPDPVDPRGTQLWQLFDDHHFTIPEGTVSLDVRIFCGMPERGYTGVKFAEFSILVDGVEVIQNPNFRGTGNWRNGEDTEIYHWAHSRPAPNRGESGNGNGRPRSTTDPGGSGRFKAQEHDPIEAHDGPVQYGEWAELVQVVEL
jgi:hypothetical protein